MATEFVYSLNRSDLVLRHDAEALLRAMKCRTWGDLARCVGLTWDEVRERFADAACAPDTAFKADEALFGGPGTELLPDPFRAALQEFRSKVGDLKWDPVVLRHLEYGTGVAGSTAQILSFDHEEGLRKVEAVMRAHNRDIVFVRDEDLFARLDRY